MSIIVEKMPQCDICHETSPDYHEQPPPTNRALRAVMRAGGWARRGHLDVCPDCAAKEAGGRRRRRRSNEASQTLLASLLCWTRVS